MKFVNKSKAIIYIADKRLDPGDAAELNKDEIKMSGVKALLDSGELEIVKEAKKKRDVADKRK